MIQFGRYYKDNNTDLEPIEWEILEEKSDKVLLISKYIIDACEWDCGMFARLTRHQELKPGITKISWSTCTLREWLNGEFLNIAFTPNEQEMIIPHVNSTPDAKRILGPSFLDSSVIIPGGPDTEDMIFLLSVPEVLRYFTKKGKPSEAVILPPGVGDDAIVMNGIETTPTKYAKSKNLYLVDSGDEKSNYWWLRSPGGADGMAAVIIYGDVLYAPGEKTDDDTIGVRPAIWVKKDAI